jgi:hypothetical protein
MIAVVVVMMDSHGVCSRLALSFVAGPCCPCSPLVSPASSAPLQLLFPDLTPCQRHIGASLSPSGCTRRPGEANPVQQSWALFLCHPDPDPLWTLSDARGRNSAPRQCSWQHAPSPVMPMLLLRLRLRPRPHSDWMWVPSELLACNARLVTTTKNPTCRGVWVRGRLGACATWCCVVPCIVVPMLTVAIVASWPARERILLAPGPGITASSVLAAPKRRMHHLPCNFSNV